MILIVDDIKANVLALKKTLELHSLVADTAESGEEALLKILKNDYSLIILDVQMPGMDGFEVAETLAGSNRTKDIPVIFLSAVSRNKKFIFKGYEAGAVDYITKPVDPDLFIMRVKTFLKLSEQRRSLKALSELLSKEIEIRKEAQDNLEQKVVERTRELREKNEELELRNHELQQFSWVVSHDLKEPIRKIQLFIKMIRDRYLADEDGANDLVNRTVRAANRMQQLISDLLDFSRLSANVPAQTVDLNDIVKDILSDYDHIILEKNARIDIKFLPIVNGVPSQFRQVFQNLLGNALKFSKDGIAPEIEISSEYLNEKDIDAEPVPYGPYCRIIVKDNGIGFEEIYMDKVFAIFQRLHDSSTFDGTGIGLAIAKKIIEKQDGIITAKSRLDEGASFIIILPINNI